jgi:NAD(P)H-dependent FMN reductase
LAKALEEAAVHRMRVFVSLLEPETELLPADIKEAQAEVEWADGFISVT